MADFKIEQRKIYDTVYLKVTLRDNSKLEIVQKLLSSLQSIKKVNITQNTIKDITIYPAKFYEIEETEEEVISQLNSFFDSSPLDPYFKQNKISELSETAYKQIIDEINKFGLNIEKLSSLKSKFNEEGYRDYFLPHLNSISTSYNATGETFNKIGKTDILIQNNHGENVFIGECKIWHGEKELLKAIDQLLERYVSWRDEYTALIMFNKENKQFSSVIDTAKKAIVKHPNFNSCVKNNSTTSISYIFNNIDDSTKKIRLELILFDCVG